MDPSGAWVTGNAGYLSRLAARRRTLRHRPEATEMRFPDVTPGGGGGAADPATPVGKADDALALAHGDDLTVESVLQSLSPTSVKSVISRAAVNVVITSSTPQRQSVVACAALDYVVSGVTRQGIVTRTAS